jgi:hypothetical protein
VTAGDLFRGTDYSDHDTFFTDLRCDTDRRRQVLAAAAKRPLEKIATFYLRRVGILQREDLAWLLSLAPGNSSPVAGPNKDTLLNMIETVFTWDSPDDFEALYDAAQTWSRLRQRYMAVFDGILLDSPEAQQLRRTLDMMKESDEQALTPSVQPPPDERVEALLDKFERGERDAWWQLNCELTLTPTSRMYGSDLNYYIADMPGWLAADEATRQRILDAAEQYLTVGETSVEEWIGTGDLRRNDLAAFRAFILLRQFEKLAYDCISPELWAKWAPAIVAVPRGDGGDKSKREMEVVADALAAAPAEFARTVRQIMHSERIRASSPGTGQTHGSSFFVLRQLEGCWNSEHLKEGIFDELRDVTNTDDQFSTILEALLIAGYAPARTYAIEIIVGATQQTRPRALEAAVCLARHCAPFAWPAIWSFIAPSSQLAREFFLKFVAYYSFQVASFAALDEQQVAGLYVLLEQLFPRSADPQQTAGRAHFIGPTESVAHLRDSLPGQIVGKGTVAAVQTMRWVVGQLPGRDWLVFQLREAEQLMRAKTWAPLTPSELIRLTESRKRLLVQSAQDLCELLTDTLRKYEEELHGEQTPVRALWDRQAGGKTFRPVEEDSLSDDVNRFLRRELVEGGIVANREVEIGRVPGAPIGSRTDIRVNALRRSAGGAYDVMTAVIETKGNWNPALFTALNDQLYSDYMVRLQAPVGVYLVGWFDKPKWDPQDRRRGAAPDCALQDAQDKLDDQASSIPSGFLVRAVVLDCHAP